VAETAAHLADVESGQAELGAGGGEVGGFGCGQGLAEDD
jgi:hypothetical protein